MPRGIETYDRDALILVQGMAAEGKTTTILQAVNNICEQTGKPWEVYILDLDRNLLPGFLKWGSAELMEPEALNRIWHISPVERLALSQHGMLKCNGVPQVWPQVLDLSKRWAERIDGKLVEAEPYSEWPAHRILAIDGLTAAAEFAFLHGKGNLAGGKRESTGELSNWSVTDYRMVPDLLKSLLTQLKYMPREFPIVVTCHMNNITLNLNKVFGDDEIAAAYENKAKRAEIAAALSKVSNAMSSVQTARMFPVLPGRAMPTQIQRLFMSVWVERDTRTGEPFMFTQPCERYTCRVPAGLPAKISGRTAMSDLLNHLQRMGARSEAPVQEDQQDQPATKQDQPAATAL